MRYVPDALSYNQRDDQLIHLVLDWQWQPAIFSNPLRHWRGNEGYNVNWNDNAAASLSRILELCGEGLTRSGLDQEHRKVHATSTQFRTRNDIKIESRSPPLQQKGKINTAKNRSPQTRSVWRSWGKYRKMGERQRERPGQRRVDAARDRYPGSWRD